MSINKKLATAALAGLLTSSFMTANAAYAEHETKGEKASGVAEKAATTAKEKHACKGQNSCKGNSPEGKNECKGKSECSTMDKK
jgi:uncharacterized membrane protein